MDTRRHTPVGRYRAPRLNQRQTTGLNQIRSGRGRHLADNVYGRDRATATSGQTFRLMLSTFLAGAVTLAVTAVVVYGSLEKRSASGVDIMAELERAQRPADTLTIGASVDGGLNWLAPKQDRLQLSTTALTARNVIHEQVRVRRNGRPFLKIKPYLRIVARLAPASRDYVDIIPSFNPIRLYAPIRSNNGGAQAQNDQGAGRVKLRVVELESATLPINDRQELRAFEVSALVAATIASDPPPPSVRFGIEQQLIDGLTPAYLSGGAPVGSIDLATAPINMTTIKRTAASSTESVFNLERREVRVIRPALDDTVDQLLLRLGAPGWVASGMAETVRGALDTVRLRSSQQVHVVLAPSLDNSAGAEPVKLTIFDEGHTHRITVKRTGTDTFVPQLEPDQEALIRAMASDGSSKANASLYAAIYSAGLAQGLTPAQILTILRIHAPDTDFGRSVGTGDTLELFYELQPDAQDRLQPTTLVYTSLTAGGEERAFWRYRSQDGTVDYFNDDGKNNRKFLLRKPVRGNDVRLTSGYGMRRHPILRRFRMHAGIDWAAPTGTPIVAAGDGVISEALRKRANGNFIRLRHANGYETTYSHMHRFGPGIRPGVRVRQGQVIGYVGTTGLSTGPHLHFEVSVNRRRVNPLKIPTLRQRSLKSSELADFKREYKRMESVMRLPPVRLAER